MFSSTSWAVLPCKFLLGNKEIVLKENPKTKNNADMILRIQQRNNCFGDTGKDRDGGTDIMHWVIHVYLLCNNKNA